jgi:hypothetical protein
MVKNRKERQAEHRPATDTPPCSKTENLKGNSGDSSQGLRSLALVVGGAVGRHGALLGSLVDSGSEVVVCNGSGSSILCLYSLSNLLAKGANAGHDGTVNSGALNRLADTLLSGLSVSHNSDESNLVFRFGAGKFTNFQQKVKRITAKSHIFSSSAFSNVRKGL